MDNTAEEAFLAGNEAAFNVIVNEYSPPLLRYCFSILGNYEDAQDVVQLIMVKLYYKRTDIRESTAVKSYLYKLAYTGCIDILRKSKRDKALQEKCEDKAILRGETYTDFSHSEGIISEELQWAFSKLKICDRALVYGIAVEEKSYSEMKYILDQSEQVLRKRYERARKKLMEWLNEAANNQHN